MKRILLTGASGTVGKEVLRQLIDMPDKPDITVFDRRTRFSQSILERYRNKAEIVYGDISVKSDISVVCSNKDIVIHLAAIIPPLADKDPALAEAVNVTGTANLIDSLKERSPGAFILYSSSISVYGDRNRNPLIKTSDPLLPSDRDEYARTKIKAESLVMNSGLRWSNLRLTAIMGINNHKPSELMFHMPLDSCLEIATPGDTGRAFVNATGHLDKLEKKIFNLSGGEKCRISYRDFLARSFEVTGLGKPDFLEGSFADKNFHCGYYVDGDALNDILDFRSETIDDYFEILRKNTPLYRKIPAILFRKTIKRNLQKRSEPLTALRNMDKSEISHYFNAS